MKNLILIFSFLLITNLGKSQDKIYLLDNSVINAKVIEIGVNEIKYKKYENLTGPDYVILKSTVALIIYENGTHEVITNAVNTIATNESENSVIDILPYYKIGKNLIGINYFDLIFKNISINYTRFFNNYKFSLGASASAGFDKNGGNSFLYFDKDYFHGILSANYFPTGMNKISYYTGLSIMAGSGADYRYYGYPIYVAEYDTKFYYGFYVNNGVQFNLTKHFDLKSSLSLGLIDRDMNGQFEVHAMFEFTAGIRF